MLLTKKCSKCLAHIPATHEFFVKDSQKKDGLYSSCRACWKKPAIKEVLPEGLKRCRDCTEIKPTSEFYFLKKGYFHSYCRKCSLARVMSRYVFSTRTPLSKEELKARKSLCNARYTASNRDKISAYHKTYYRDNCTDLRNKSRTWAKNNKEKVLLANKEKKARRRALEAGATGSFSKSQLIDLYSLQSGRCFWCSVDLDGKYHADHYIPLKRGGSNDISNIVISCPPCNHSRRDRLPNEWQGVAA